MSAGFTSEGIERLHEIVESHVGDGLVPGLVALVARGDEVHVFARGQLTIGGRAVARDSLFRLSSTTKPVTAAATLAVAEEGLLDLDEPVDRLLPELASRRVLTRMDGPLDRTVAAWRAITPRDLLTFTFGFGMALAMFMAPEPWPIFEAAERQLSLSTLGPPDPGVQPDPDTWIARLGTLPLMAQPGERWLYNTGASVLGVLLARATGQPFAEVLKTRVFEPLGMSDTAFWTADTERLATAYRPTPEGLVVWDEPAGAWSRPPAFADGGAGLVSTADDMLAFARMLLGGGTIPSGTIRSGALGGRVFGGAGVGRVGSGAERMLSRESVEAMCADQLTSAQKEHGGLGPGFFSARSWGFCQAVYDDGSFGWDGGFGSSWRVDPANDLVVIVLTQRMFETSDPPQVHLDIQRAASVALSA
ncbi:MAG TPA: serine hydrolase domain-containing protein [Solirubrobacteraceae bacterium]|nr:serine hydrolase domain-containing protein [Solirubrobacteraceae bacterium]